jgi:uncharacterized protein (TIGR01777 family)
VHVIQPNAAVEHTTRLPWPEATVRAWYARPGAFERLAPPWERLRSAAPSGGAEQDAVEVRAPLGWRWVHRRRIEPDGPAACAVEDRIEYRAPSGLPDAVAGRLIRPRLERLLAYGETVLGHDLEAHARFAELARLRVAITGASGLIGRALVPFLTTGGHEIVRMTRGRNKHGVRWDYESGRIDREGLEGLSAVVHLAGENVGARWTRERRRRILESRVIGTRFLAEALARLRRPPQVLVSASGVGIYGEHGDEVVTEATPVTGVREDFLTAVGRDWEAATAPARKAGIRTVCTRQGVVLTPAGGALGRMLPAFLAGVGGPLGGGGQWMSWIGMEDMIGVLHHALMDQALDGPINATSPQPVTNREFAATLGRVLHRPAVFPVPAPALRLVFGEMADVALLTSIRAVPERLRETGYAFRYPGLEGALRFELGRKG